MNLCSTNVKVYWSLHCVKKAIEINAEVRGNLALYHFVMNTG